QPCGKSEDHQPSEKRVADPSRQTLCQGRRRKGHERAPEEGEGDACAQKMSQAGSRAQKSQGPERKDNLGAELQMVRRGIFERSVPGGIKFKRRRLRPTKEKCRHKNQGETGWPSNPPGGW